MHLPERERTFKTAGLILKLQRSLLDEVTCVHSIVSIGMFMSTEEDMLSLCCSVCMPE